MTPGQNSQDKSVEAFNKAAERLIQPQRKSGCPRSRGVRDLGVSLTPSYSPNLGRFDAGITVPSAALGQASRLRSSAAADFSSLRITPILDHREARCPRSRAVRDLGFSLTPSCFSECGQFRCGNNRSPGCARRKAALYGMCRAISTALPAAIAPLWLMPRKTARSFE